LGAKHSQDVAGTVVGYGLRQTMT